MYPLDDLLNNSTDKTAPPVTDNNTTETNNQNTEETKNPADNNNTTTNEEPPPPPIRPKRNCGRTGATTPAGRIRSSQNARKHGATSTTYIFNGESPEGLPLVLARWQEKYIAEEGSVEDQAIQKVARAEWILFRNERFYDDFLRSTMDLAPYEYNDEQVHRHALMLRYVNEAEGKFRRAFRDLEFLYRTNRIQEKEEAAEAKAQNQKQAKRDYKTNPVDPLDPEEGIDFQAREGTDEEIAALRAAKHPPLPEDRPVRQPHPRPNTPPPASNLDPAGPTG